MFHSDIKEVRKNNTHSTIERYLLHTPINGIKTSKYGDVINKFVLLDTPGLDEISTTNFNTDYVKKISFKELRNSDALIIVLDYQNFMSDIKWKILKLISSNEKLIERDRNKIFLLLIRLICLIVRMKV